MEEWGEGRGEGISIQTTALLSPALSSLGGKRGRRRCSLGGRAKLRPFCGDHSFRPCVLCHVDDYRGRSRFLDQRTFPPQQEMETFRFADSQLTIELVAAEPDVVSPVAIAWDADGRMFVAEMSDYPTGPKGGRIRMLEDRDGDGRYERATIFATN